MTVRQVARKRRQVKRALTSGGETPPCGGTEYTFGTSVVQLDGWVDEVDYEQKYSPGDTLLITSGSRDHLKIRNIHGTAECPIIIRNNSGAVVFTSTTESGIQIENCQHVHLDGAGAGGVEYGFQATASLGGDQAVFIGFRSKHLKINNVEAANTTMSGFMLHTKSDGGRDYGNDPVGTPSTFTGPNAWLDEDVTFIHVYSHDNGSSGYYLGNNHAKRDNNCDLANLTIYDSIANDNGAGGFNFKTQTNLVAYDLTADSNGANFNPSFQYNYNLDPGCSGVLRDSVGTNISANVNRGINMRNAFRPMEVYNMTISGSNSRSIHVTHPAAEEDDGGTVNIHNNTLNSPGQDGIVFDVQNVLAALFSKIEDNAIEYPTAYSCIDVRDQPIGTESGNTCTPI